MIQMDGKVLFRVSRRQNITRIFHNMCYFIFRYVLHSVELVYFISLLSCIECWCFALNGRSSNNNRSGSSVSKAKKTIRFKKEGRKRKSLHVHTQIFMIVCLFAVASSCWFHSSGTCYTKCIDASCMHSRQEHQSQFARKTRYQS